MKPSLLVLAVALALPACKKDAPEASLPAATQVGANTAGCLIDGKPFIAASYGGGILSNPIPGLEYGFAFDSAYYLVMNGSLNGKYVSVSLFLRSDRAGIYLLNKDTRYYPQATAKYVLDHATYSVVNSSGETYVTNAKCNGEVTINRSDLKNSISSGTFSFTAASDFDSRKTIVITSGRFDRKQ